MIRANSLLLAAATLGFFPATLAADVIAESFLELTQLQITPSAGTIQFTNLDTTNLPQGPFPNWWAEVNAHDSYSAGPEAIHAGHTSGSTSAQLNWDGVAANASVSFAPLILSASASVDIPHPPGVSPICVLLGDCSHYSSQIGSGPFFEDAFEIVGTTGPVGVQFSASLTGKQFGMAPTGDNASSDIGYWLDFYDATDFVPPYVSAFNFDSSLVTNALTGPDSFSFSYNKTLVQSETLLPNHVYYFSTGVQAGAGVDTVVPEPPASIASGLGLCILVLIGNRKSPLGLRSR